MNLSKLNKKQIIDKFKVKLPQNYKEVFYKYYYFEKIKTYWKVVKDIGIFLLCEDDGHRYWMFVGFIEDNEDYNKEKKEVFKIEILINDLHNIKDAVFLAPYEFKKFKNDIRKR